MNRPSDPLHPETVAVTWPERNRSWMSECFIRWRHRLEWGESAEGIATEAVPANLEPDDFVPAARRVAMLFGMSKFESELLLLAAGIEIDGALRDAVALAQATPGANDLRLSFSLAMTLLQEPHWDALSPAGPLRYWSLVHVDTRAGLAGATLRIDEHVLHHLTGVASVDPRLIGLARFQAVAVAATDVESRFASQVALAIGELLRPLVMLANAAADATHKRAGRLQACAVFERLGLRTLWVDISSVASTLGGDARELVAVARHLDREAALEHAGVAFEVGAEGTHHGSALRLIAAMESPVIVLGSYSPDQLADLVSREALRFNLPPAGDSRKRRVSPAVERATVCAMQQFHIEPALLDQALNALAGLEDEAAIEQSLWDMLREAARGGLDVLARRIESRATFDDLVLPRYVSAQLREIASQLRHRHQVYEEWGFGQSHDRGQGIAALFTGESGTGKTLAAEAIANEARLDLYRIDLASVVSKYIGETEKNLSRVFDAAEVSGAVLLFDEADALFGKRSEVKDSHDRYANIEVAYLLQRIESYRGLAILTSNMKSALDRSFLRRIRFVVQFPFPDAVARAEIWRRQFPPAAPLDPVDFAALAKLQLAGGNIRAVALNAAFKAADRRCKIDHGILIEASHAEHAKLERSMRNASIGSGE